jgi:Rnl2 family RNA ligase
MQAIGKKPGIAGEKRQFKKYHEIDNLSGSFKKDEFIRAVRANPNAQWVVHEKIHGANFSIHVRNEDSSVDIKFAKRSSFLTEQEMRTEKSSFFRVGTILPDLEAKATALAESIPHINKFIIYGELFGNGYPTMVDGKLKFGANTPVQRGVYYSNDLLFYAFDIYTFNEESYGDWMNYHDAKEYLENAGFTCAPEIMFGTFEECKQIDLDQVSRISQFLGLPEIEGFQNIWEGVVIKPVTCLRNERGRRVVYKHKHPNFSEVMKKGKGKKKNVKPNVVAEIEPELQAVINEITRYCTTNRYEGVISKYGEYEKIHKLRAMFMKDIHKDFKKDHPEMYESVTSAQRKILDKELNTPVNNAIIRYNSQ